MSWTNSHLGKALIFICTLHEKQYQNIIRWFAIGEKAEKNALAEYFIQFQTEAKMRDIKIRSLRKLIKELEAKKQQLVKL